MVKELLIIIDEKGFNFPKGTKSPTEEEVAEAIKNELGGYTGPGAGWEGRFWAGVNLKIKELPEKPGDESEPPTPPDVLKTFKTLAPPGSPPEQIAAAMGLAAELKQAQKHK